MTEAALTKNCAVCQKPFVVQTNNRGHAKYCSKACQRKGQGYRKGAGKTEAICITCGKPFWFYPSIRAGKFCSLACRKADFAKPSADRGFIDLTGQIFERWNVISYAGYWKTHHHWNVQCSCAAKTERVVTTNSLRRGDSWSCGCIAHEGKPRPDFKVCNRCRDKFPFTDEFFAKKPGFRWGLAPICRTCWRPIARARHLRFRRRLKLEVLSHYSHGEPRCACCGIKEIEFLTLDHINDDGKEDRKNHGLGAVFYARMKKLGYPDHLQVLCFNCNIARSHFGVCPHKADKADR